jgi:hypothetical protein
MALAVSLGEDYFGRGASGVGPTVEDRQPRAGGFCRWLRSGIDNWTAGPKPRLSEGATGPVCADRRGGAGS